MERRVLKYFLLLSLLAPLTLAAQRPAKGRKTVVQQPAPVSYDSLAMRRNELAGKEARLKERLDEARELFSSDSPGKEALGANIVELEQALFDVRADLESLSETMARMEREQGFSLPVMPAATAAADNGKTMLVDNDYFRDNLSAADYKQLLAAQKKESEVAELIGKLQENYDQMALLLPVYHVAVKGPQADSLHARITALAAENERLAPAIGDLWQSVFDTKVYAYNYVLDKNGESDILAVQEKQMNNMLLLEAEIEGEYMYEEVARYALQKLLIAGYEIRIADRAGLTGGGGFAQQPHPSHQPYRRLFPARARHPRTHVLRFCRCPNCAACEICEYQPGTAGRDISTRFDVPDTVRRLFETAARIGLQECLSAVAGDESRPEALLLCRRICDLCRSGRGGGPA